MNPAPLSLWPWRLPRRPTPVPEPIEVISAVADAHGIALKHLLGREKTPTLNLVRQEAMAAALTQGCSSPAVGRAMGRDHTTVLHGAAAHARRQRAVATP